MHKDWWGQLRLMVFIFFHFIGEDPEIMVSLIGSSLQGVGHSFSFFPSRRRCLYRQPVRFGVTYVDRMARMPLDILWSNSGDYRRTMAERTVFSPVTLGWSFRPFLCWYLGSVSPVLFPLYLQCVSDQVLFFLCLLFCHKNAQLNCYTPFRKWRTGKRERKDPFFVFRRSDYRSDIFSWRPTLEISDNLIVK